MASSSASSKAMNLITESVVISLWSFLMFSKVKTVILARVLRAAPTSFVAAGIVAPPVAAAAAAAEAALVSCNPDAMIALPMLLAASHLT